MQTGQGIAAGQALDMLLAAITHRAGHRQGDQHHCHHPLDQRDLDDDAAIDRQIDQAAGGERRNHLDQVEESMDQQHRAQLPLSGIAPAQQQARPYRQDADHERLHHQQYLGPPGLIGQLQHPQPDRREGPPAQTQAPPGEARHAKQEEAMHQDQQPIGEPDAHQQQPLATQQRQGATHANQGETRAPVQQRDSRTDRHSMAR